MRSKKKRKPKLTRIEKMTKGLMLSSEEIKSKFSVREVEGKGRALFLTSRTIRKDSFVLEYEGDIITHDEAELREKIYEMNDEGCYILFFRFQERKLAIDATRKFGSYARYLNHSREPNIRFHPPLLLDLTGQGVPRIPAYALRDIYEGEEIVFDYGIKDGQISWLRNRKRCHASELTDSSSEEDSSSSDDDSEASKKDQIMSVTRTPTRNLSLKPSKYLTPLKNSALSSKPPSLTIPRDGYGIRYIIYPSRPGMRKCYIASMEGLGQPLKIMRSVEERTSTSKGSGAKCSQSVITLSESDDSSIKSPVTLIPSEPFPVSRDSCLPVNTTPSSTSKVIEWQQKIKSSPVKQEDTISDIKILHVRSLTEENESPASSSTSPFSSSTCPSSKRGQTDTDSTQPIISNVINGSYVPKNFVPKMQHNNSDSVRMSAHHIPEKSPRPSTCNSPRQFHPNIQRTHHPPSQFHSPSNLDSHRVDGVGSGALIKSPSGSRQRLVKQNSVRPSLLHKQSNANDMICLSDSEEEDILQSVSCDSRLSPQKSSNEFSVKNQRHDYQSKFVPNAEYSKGLSTHDRMHTVQDNQESHFKDKIEDILISNIESLNPGHHDIYHNQRHEAPSETYNQNRKTPSIDQNEKIQCEYQIQNNSKVQSQPQLQGNKSSKEFINGNGQVAYPSEGSNVRREFHSQKNKVHRENESSHFESRHQNHHKQSVEIVDSSNIDVVEIFDEEESDFEIISDNELSSSVQNKVLSQYHESVSSTRPSCSRMSTVPSNSDTHPHRSKPHIAIVKPYSKENDQNDQDVGVEEPTPHNNAGTELQGGKPADDDVIELVEGNSSEDDDGIVLTEYNKPAIKLENCDLTHAEIEMMKEIFQPLILSSDSLSSSCVEKAISENFTFFSVLIGRGVPVNEIRRTVWKLFKASGKETQMPS